MVRSLVAFVAVLVAPVLALAQPLADRVPEGAMLYVGWQGAQAMPPAYAESHLKAVLENSNIPAFFNAFVPRLMQRIGREEPQVNQIWAMVRAIGGPMWRHPSALYVAGVDFQNPAGPVPKAGVICQAGNEADALFNQLKPLGDQLAQQAPFPVKVFRVGDIVGFAIGYAAEEMAMAGRESPDRPRPISASPRFQEALNRVQKDPVVVKYIDTEAAFALVSQVITASQDNEALANWNKAREALGLDGVKRVIVTGGFDARAWSWRAFIAAPAPRAGVLAIVGRATVNDNSLQLVPPTATTVEASVANLTTMLDAVRQVMGVVDPQAARDLDRTLAEIDRTLGFNLRNDLLDAFGNDWITYSDPQSTGGGMFGTVIANRLAQPAQAESNLVKLEAWINKKIAEEVHDEDIQISIRQQTIDGMTVHTLPVPLVAPSWAIKDGVFYAGLYPQVVVAAAQADRSKSILDNQAFVALRQRLGVQKPVTLSYVDLPRTAPSAYQIILPLSQLGLGLADMFGVQTPPLVVPPLNVLMKELSPTEDAFWTDDAGWHYRAITPFPGAKLLASDANLTVGSAAMMVSILLPAMNSAKERANRVKCASNLRQIGQGMMLYANDHQGRFPPNMAVLVREVDLHPSAFVCPTASAPPPPNVLGNLDNAIRWVEQNTDYVYLGANMIANMANPADTIIAHEKFENHEGEGINMLFGDGHVEWVPMPRARQLLQQRAK